jgi:hypothetical protein
MNVLLVRRHKALVLLVRRHKALVLLVRRHKALVLLVRRLTELLPATTPKSLALQIRTLQTQVRKMKMTAREAAEGKRRCTQSLRNLKFLTMSTRLWPAAKAA